MNDCRLPDRPAQSSATLHFQRRTFYRFPRRRANLVVRAYNAAVQDSKLVVAQSYGTRPEAELAKGALEAAGIQAIIQADTVGGMREHLAWSGPGFKVVVREDDATAARDVLSSPPDRKSRKPRC